MTDKEMIEEMAQEIFNTCAWRFGRPNDYKEIFNDIAEDLIKLNYRKIPEGSVVLSLQEHENDIYSAYNRGYRSGSKETARKILKDIADCMRSFEDDDDGYLLKKGEFKFFMREIATREGVEIKE